jgi:hypothetical protein
MPHLLDGCYAKLGRAEESIANLQAEIATFFNGNPKPYEIVGEHQSDGLKYQFVVRGNPTLPLRFAVLAGEIVHHQRSILDHLLYSLIIRNSRSPTRKNQFPICSTLQKYEDACKNGMIKGVSKSAEKLIRAAQPFTNPTPEDTIFYVINEYDNFDKHRLLIVVSTVAQLGQNIEIGVNQQVLDQLGSAAKTPNIVSFGNANPRAVSSDGDCVWEIGLAEPAPQFKAQAEFLSEVAFEKCGKTTLQPVVPMLRNFNAAVSNMIQSARGEF